MSVRKINPIIKDIYYVISMGMNFFLVLAVFFIVVHFVAPLLGGKLLFSALILYGSWIGMALFLKFTVKCAQKGLRIKKSHYVLLSLYNTACTFLWFPYPIAILISIFCIVSIVFAYQAQERRRGQRGHL